VFPNKSMETRRRAYNFRLAKFGGHNSDSLVFGMDLARTLVLPYCGVERHRLWTKLLTIGYCIHSHDHHLTKKAEVDYNDIQSVLLCTLEHESLGDQPMRYKGLRYEDSGKNCDVRQSEQDPPVSVPSNSVLFYIGTPVICHGLENVIHLNGKIGDVQSCNKTTKQYGVHLKEACWGRAK